MSHSQKLPIAVAMLLGICFFLAPANMLASNKKKRPEKINETELQGMLMAFADTYAGTIGQSTVILENKLATAKERKVVRAALVHGTSAAYDIAAGPSPVGAVLDMVVMVTLQRMVWEEYWYPQVFGDPAMAHLAAFRKLEDQIWAIVGRMFTPEQQDNLRQLIIEWRRTHPDQLIVADIRFANFRQMQEVFHLFKKIPLLSSVGKAVDTAEELRLLGERLRYQLSRMLLLTNSQMELLYFQMFSQPEMKQLLKNMDKFSATADQLTETAAQLPDAGKYLINKLEADEKLYRGLLTDLRLTLEQGSEMTALVNTTLLTTETLVARFEKTKPAAKDKKPVSIDDIRATVTETTTTVRELNTLVTAIDQFLSNPDRQQRVATMVKTFGQIEIGAKGLIDHAFYRLLVLIVVLLAGIFLIMLASRYISFGRDRASKRRHTT
jgi:hypothetical protein